MKKLLILSAHRAKILVQRLDVLMAKLQVMQQQAHPHQPPVKPRLRERQTEHTMKQCLLAQMHRWYKP